jgi:hypothetical protein
MRIIAFLGIVLGYAGVIGAGFNDFSSAGRLGAMVVLASVVILRLTYRSHRNEMARNLLMLAIAGGAILLAGLHPGYDPNLWAVIGATMALPGLIMFARRTDLIIQVLSDK